MILIYDISTIIRVILLPKCRFLNIKISIYFSIDFIIGNWQIYQHPGDIRIFQRESYLISESIIFGGGKG